MDHNSPSLPDIPIMKESNVRPMPLSVATRIEVVCNVIADVLHNAYQVQAGLPPTNFNSLPGDVQRVYEGMARLAVVPLLDENALKVAEGKAIESAAGILLNYLNEDNMVEAEFVPPERWEYRVTAIVRSAIAVYQKSLMEVPR